MVGKWFVRRLNLAMAVYTVVLSVGFMVAFPLIGATVIRNGWRTTWWAIGLALLFGLAPLSVLLVRKSPETCLLENDGEISGSRRDVGFTLWQALATPSFWVFGIASSLRPDCVGNCSLQRIDSG